MRETKLAITYNSADISAAIAPYITEFTYTDEADGKADSISLHLADIDGRWRAGWYPKKGATLTAALILMDDGLTTLNGTTTIVCECGDFTIDEIEISGPPSLIAIKAASADLNKSIRQEKKTVGRENITLEHLAADIASQHGLTAYYNANDILFRRIDQRQESDLAFLARICRDNGLNLKMSRGRIILYSGRSFEAKNPAMVIDRPGNQLKRYRFTDKAHNVYRSCEVMYQDAADKTLKSFVFTPPQGPTIGEVLKVTRRCESLAEAERAAKAELRQRNKTACSGSITLIGYPGFVAGLNTALTGFGQFDGNYFIDSASHRYDRGQGGYTTTIKIHRELNY